MTKEKPRTPHMDDKHIPSPPTRTVEQYEEDKKKGINPVGQVIDKLGA